MDLRTMTVAEVSERWPETAPVLDRRGIDTCCGGMHTLQEVSEHHGVPLPDLIAELEAVIAPSGARPKR